jgi:hypothetical protein
MIGTQSQPQWTGQPSRGEVESITRVQYPFEALVVPQDSRENSFFALLSSKSFSLLV